MAKINIVKPRQPRKFSTDRRDPAEVLGMEEAGASPSGNSYWKQKRLCPRESALAKIVGLRREGDSEPLTQGLTFHHALEHYYATIQESQRTTKARRGSKAYCFAGLADAEAAAWASVLPLADEPNFEDTWTEVERLLAAYFDMYRRFDRWRILAVEDTLEYEDAGKARRGASLGPMRYSCRRDLVVEDYERKGTWIIEHKTSRVITEDLVAGYQLDQQTLGQCWLHEEFLDEFPAGWPPLRGCLVNITSKHKVPRFERIEVMPSRAHLDAFERSMRAHTQMEALFERLGHPKFLGNCTGPSRYWSKCDYFEICHGDPSATIEDIMEMDPPIGFVKEEQEDL